MTNSYCIKHGYYDREENTTIPSCPGCTVSLQIPELAITFNSEKVSMKTWKELFILLDVIADQRNEINSYIEANKWKDARIKYLDKFNNWNVAEELTKLEAQLKASRLIMDYYKKEITRLREDCEAYRTEPVSILQEEIDELKVQLDEVDKVKALEFYESKGDKAPEKL